MKKTSVLKLWWMIMVAIDGFILSLGTIADGVQPPSYPSDQHMADLETHIHEEVVAKCGREQTATYCADRIRVNVEREYPPRGTLRYARQYYSGLDDRELWKLQKTLADLIKAARPQREFYVDNPKPPGELTKEMLSNELHWVDREIDTRDRQARAGPGGGLRGLARDIEKLGSH